MPISQGFFEFAFEESTLPNPPQSSQRQVPSVFGIAGWLNGDRGYNSLAARPLQPHPFAFRDFLFSAEIFGPLFFLNHFNGRALKFGVYFPERAP
jgi:hypothetical protein